MPVVSVVIPAHNEATVIERCLATLGAGSADDQIEIVVVCNGCGDDTAVRARAFPGVKVVEIEVASKIAALNEGDRHCSVFPVAYIDADVQITAQDLLKAAAHLQHPDIKIVSPQPTVVLDGASALVKAFYKVWLKLPYFADKRMVGSGVYILSREGRSRFDVFPQVIADDGYVRSLFKPEERLTVTSASFRIFAPRNLASLIRIKTRVRLGNQDVKRRFPAQKLGGENKPESLGKLFIRSPWLIPAGCVYAFVQLCTAVEVKRRQGSAEMLGWARDESSRT